MRLLTLAFLSLILFPLTANAVAHDCTNKNAKRVFTNRTGSQAANSDSGHHICVHKTKYFIKDTKCPKGYSESGNTCKKTTEPKKKCAVGKKLCSNSYCVGALKACKTSNKSGMPNLNCSTGYRLSGNSCIKTKNPIKDNTKCPFGWFKAKFGPDAKNKNKFYCKTTK